MSKILAMCASSFHISPLYSSQLSLLLGFL